MLDHDGVDLADVQEAAMEAAQRGREIASADALPTCVFLLAYSELPASAPLTCWARISSRFVSGHKSVKPSAFLRARCSKSGKNRLAKKVDEFIGHECCSGGFVEICAHKDAAQGMALVKLASSHHVAAAYREAKVHYDDIGIERGRSRNCFGGRRCACA